MRAFLVFSCIIVAAWARPDVSLGYRYPQPGVSGHEGGVGLVAPAGSVNVPSALYAPSFSGGSGLLGGGFSGGGQFGGANGHFASGSAPGLSFGGISSGPGSSFSGSGFSSVPAFGGHHGGHGGHEGGASFHSGHYDQTPIITKHFYLHAAPEEQQESITKHITIGRPQKNYRVVFIKAPASNTGAARISASYAPTEEKTVIYVLAKKPDEISLGDIATPAPTEPSKPEVFFIKYKTPQEAAHAQQQIQAQYDALGGSSQLTDEGTGQVSSVIGVLGGGLDAAGSGHSGTSKYLPPNH